MREHGNRVEELTPHQANEQRLAALRARTDRDLIAIIQNRLAAALQFARAHDTSSDACARAEQGYAEAALLLRAVTNRAEAVRLNSQLSEVREQLNEACACA